MANVIFLSNAVISADGLTVTCTLAGGTAPYSVTTPTAIAAADPPFLTVSGGFAIPAVSASASGSTLTVAMTIPVGSNETVANLRITDAMTITDAAGNAVGPADFNLPIGQLTNNSAVPISVTYPGTVGNPLEALGPWLANSTGTLASIGRWLDDTPLTGPGRPSDAPLEFVVNATGVAVHGWPAGGLVVGSSIDGGTMAPPATPAYSSFSAYPLAAGLPAADHLVRIVPSNFYAVRVWGGTRAFKNVPTTKVPFCDGATAAQLSSTTPIYLTNGWIENATPSNGGSGPVGQGEVFEVGFTGTGVEVAWLQAGFTSLAVSVDGGPGKAAAPNDGQQGELRAMVPLVSGLTKGYHTLQVTVLAGGWFYGGLRITNGAVLTAAAAAGATTLTVNSTTDITVGDWVRIGSYSSREHKRVTAISGNILTLSSALANAQPLKYPVTSYSAPAGEVSPWRSKTRTGLMAFIGDSNTQGSNEYGGGEPPIPDPATGETPVPYDIRYFGGQRVADELAIETVNLSQQGTTADFGAAVTAQAAFTGRRHGLTYDRVFIWYGTNDVGQRTPAQYEADIRATIANALPLLTPGTGRVVLVPPATQYPWTTTGSGGLSINLIRTILPAIASGNPRVVYAGELASTLINPNDINGLHYNTVGRRKVGEQLRPHMTGLIQSMGMMGA